MNESARKDEVIWTKPFVTWTLVGVVATIAFLIFRLFIVSDKDNSFLKSDYSSEIAAAFVGTLLTIIVTALLLDQTMKSQQKLARQQTENEEGKEKMSRGTTRN